MRASHNRSKTMKRQWLLTAIAVTGLAMASPAALAKKHRTISEEEAAMIANSAIGGRVVDVDYEKRKHGRSYYEVEIRKDGRTYEVYVDAKTGQLLDMGGERDRDRDEIEDVDTTIWGERSENQGVVVRRTHRVSGREEDDRGPHGQEKSEASRYQRTQQIPRGHRPHAGVVRRRGAAALEPVLASRVRAYASTSAPAEPSGGAEAVTVLLGVRSTDESALWIAALAFIVFIAVSRLYLGVHWLTDVLGGFGIGLGSTMILTPFLLGPNVLRRAL